MVVQNVVKLERANTRGLRFKEVVGHIESALILEESAAGYAEKVKHALTIETEYRFHVNERLADTRITPGARKNYENKKMYLLNAHAALTNKKPTGPTTPIILQAKKDGNTP